MNYQDLLSTVSTLHTAALHGASRAVNRLHVLRNWAIGCVIFEFEQNGSDRAEYGEGMLKNLAADLAIRSVTGLGLSTLKGCRTFYRMYPQIGQAVIGQFGSLLEKPTTPHRGGRRPLAATPPRRGIATMPDHLVLHGCRREILGHFLKAIGLRRVLRHCPAPELFPVWISRQRSL